VPSDFAVRLSPHFRLSEFRCRNGVPVPSACVDLLARDLVRGVLEPLRAEFGTCHVLSGFRPAAYNASIGGASDSRHIYKADATRGLAADVYFASGGPRAWAASAGRILDGHGWGGGVGVYVAKGFVHVDSRRFRARWSG
jgi:uncharacterized protein YcbK (DUF882 family)